MLCTISQQIEFRIFYMYGIMEEIRDIKIGELIFRESVQTYNRKLVVNRITYFE